MQRNLVKKNVYNTGRSTASQEFIYQHMSNHYRRILNAKKVVDTSPPHCYNHKKLNSSHVVPALPSARSFKAKNSFAGGNISPAATDRSVSTNSYSGGTGPYPSSRYHIGCVVEHSSQYTSKKFPNDKNLSDRSNFDRKNCSSACCEDNWTDVKRECNNKDLKIPTAQSICKCCGTHSRNSKRRLRSRENESTQKRIHTVEGKQEPQPTDKSAKRNCFLSPTYLTFTPKILKTNAVSKLRSLRVYYPPRRKMKRSENKRTPEILLESSTGSPPRLNICVCEAPSHGKKGQVVDKVKEQVQTSSRDSAYNGGVSSLPESRSPTPDRKTKKESACCCCNGNDRAFTRNEPENKLTCSRNGTEKPKSREKSISSTLKQRDKETELQTEPKLNWENQTRKLKEDDLYIKFIEDITDEVLEKCLYTNKSLKKIMKKHILKNMETLDKNRMLKEVDNLRLRLGIPEDLSLFDLNVTHTNSHGDLINACQVISDSAFVMPDEEGKRSSDEGCSCAFDGLPNKGNYPSQRKESIGFRSDNEDELISVSQVQKLVKENKKKMATTTASPVKSPVSYDYSKYSSGDSDVSFGSFNDNAAKRNSPKKEPEMLKNDKQEDTRCPSGSSSEIEEDISEELFVEEADTDAKQVPEPETLATCVLKRSRTVSFWNNVEDRDRPKRKDE